MEFSPHDMFASLHSRPVASPKTCLASFRHDYTGMILSLAMCVGLIVSYAPQHYRIIHSKTSEGLSPFFLLLGATSSAASFFNILTLQWGQVACCQYLSAGQCFENVLGIAQVFIQWFCFNLIFVLYLFYYPRTKRYVRNLPLDSAALATRPIQSLGSLFGALVPEFMKSPHPSRVRRASASSSGSSASSASGEGFDPNSFVLPGELRRGEISFSPEYRHAVSLFCLTALHLALTALTTGILLTVLPKNPHSGSPPAGHPAGREHPSEAAVRVWATTLGVTSVILAMWQYVPQLVLTARTRLVGSLSIPMMCLQTPGSAIFVYTLAVRPGVNWTGWATYAVTGLFQGGLLVLCICWKRRQRVLGIDDWGRKKGDAAGDGVADERTGLLPGGSRR